MDKEFKEKFGCILEEKWGYGKKKDTIVGVWGEDGNEYEIKVPPQLREAIICMQRAIQMKYKNIINVERETQRKILILNSLMEEL